MKKLFALIYLCFSVSILWPQLREKEEAKVTFIVSDYNDADYNVYTKKLADSFATWLTTRGNQELKEFTWNVRVRPAGWNKVVIEVKTEFPQRFREIHSDRFFVKLARACDDPTLAMKPVIEYMVELPKKLEKMSVQKY